MEARKIERVEEMPVFQAFYRLAIDIEKATRSSGSEFRWLRVQVLRSSESVCAGMTEGFYSQYSTEYLQALHRCRREARETSLHLRYAADTGALAADLVGQFEARADDSLRQLGAVIVSIERKIRDRGKAKPVAPLVKEDDANYSLSHVPSTIPHQPSPMTHSS